MGAIVGATKQAVLHGLFDEYLNMVFNPGVIHSHGDIMTNDKQLIEELGGPAKVAELLGYNKDGGVQRVHNWTTRGIPPKVKLAHPDIFLKSRPIAAEA